MYSILINRSRICLLVLVCFLASCAPDYTASFQYTLKEKKQKKNKKTVSEPLVSVKNKIEKKGYSLKTHKRKLKTVIAESSNKEGEIEKNALKNNLLDTYDIDEKEMEAAAKQLSKQDKQYMINELRGFSKMSPQENKEIAATNNFSGDTRTGIILIVIGLILALIGGLLPGVGVIFWAVGVIALIVGLIFLLFALID